MGWQLKWRPFYSPLERAWKMRLQCYNPMPDGTQALIASPKLHAIYLCVPLHLSLLFPLALGVLAPPLVTFSNMSIPCSAAKCPFSIHLSVLHLFVVTPSAPLCLSFQMTRARNVKSVAKAVIYGRWLIFFLLFTLLSILFLSCPCNLRDFCFKNNNIKGTFSYCELC